MQSIPFWTDDFPRPDDLPVTKELPSQVDVAIIGGGYTGLSAARTLAKSGASVAVLERETIGWGASSRNGGMTGCGLKNSTPIIFKRYGEKYGHMFWQASLDALELIKELIYEEGIQCDWRQDGDLALAVKPSHFEHFKQKVKWHKETLGHELHVVPPSELRSHIGSDGYYGGLIDGHGAGLHPAKLVFGLAKVAAKYGALLFEEAGVYDIKKQADGYLLQTMRGELKAREVITGTNGYTDKVVKDLKPRVLLVGSYSIVTEPLSEELQKELSPTGKMLWNSKWFLNYFRLTPDGRMLWGGRNDLSTTLDLEKSASVLRSQMVAAFPQLANCPITHTWTGQLGLTFDLMPHIGRVNGIHYALGYGGHGLHTALLLGREVAQLITGEKTSSPFAEISHQTYFFYRDKPWFMPLVVNYYRLRDWMP